MVHVGVVVLSGTCRGGRVQWYMSGWSCSVVHVGVVVFSGTLGTASM